MPPYMPVVPGIKATDDSIRKRIINMDNNAGAEIVGSNGLPDIGTGDHRFLTLDQGKAGMAKRRKGSIAASHSCKHGRFIDKEISHSAVCWEGAHIPDTA